MYFLLASLSPVNLHMLARRHQHTTDQLFGAWSASDMATSVPTATATQSASRPLTIQAELLATERLAYDASAANGAALALGGFTAVLILMLLACCAE